MNPGLVLVLTFCAGYIVGALVMVLSERPARKVDKPTSRSRGTVTVLRPGGFLTYEMSSSGYECQQCHNRARTPALVEHERWCPGSPFYSKPPRPTR